LRYEIKSESKNAIDSISLDDDAEWESIGSYWALEKILR
jgi:hypothetical protein